MFQQIFNPQPIHQKSLGFEPNLYIRCLRIVAAAIIFCLRLNGRNRFSNEFVQQLDPKKTVRLRNGKSLTFRTGHGRLLWRVNTSEDDEPLLNDWIATFSANDVFYDVGACVGNYSLIAALNGTQVVAIEAEMNNLQILYENIYLNDLFDHVMPICMALNDETKKETFYVRSHSKGDAMHSVGSEAVYLDSFTGSKVEVLAMRLDDLISTFNLPSPNKLKIDVDTNELRILKGAEATLVGCDEVYVELCLDIEEHTKIVDFMEHKGFQLKEMEPEIRPFMNNVYNAFFVKAD